MIRILLVDDQKTVRESLRSWLEPVENFQIVGTASDGHSAIEQVEILEPDVVLVDMEMPVLDGVETTRIICQKFIGVKVIVLSMHDGHEYVSRSLQAGATGYLLKNTPREQLIEAIIFVNRGYSQFSPGLAAKIASALPAKQLEVRADRGLERSKLVDIASSVAPPQTVNTKIKPRGKQFYLKIWLLGNLIIWGGSLAYMQFKQPVYKSKWAIALPASNSYSTIDIPGVGQASSKSESPYNSDFSDPRENYKYLATTDEVLTNAASSLEIPIDEFGKPKINTPGNTTLIEFQIEAEQPEVARAKAIALQDSLKTSLKRLRQDESNDRSQDLADTLAVAEEKLRSAQQKLAQFQISSGLGSVEQTSNLTYNIEQLRKQQAEIVAQEQKVRSRFNQLQSNLGLSAQAAANALTLQSDSEFKEYLSSYSQISRELANLRAKFSANHPSVIEKEAEQSQTQAELNRRGELLLGKPLTSADLKNINADSGSSLSQRGNLFQELVSLQAEQTGLADQAQSLKSQIAQLETKRSQMSQSGSKLQQLEKDVQLAQAVYSSTATKLDLSRSQTSASYPPISLVSSPSLPKSVAAPQKSLVMLGSLMSSLLLTTGLFTFWQKEERDRAMLISEPSTEKSSQNGKGYYYLPPISSDKTKANAVKRRRG